jgi:2-C-methyl-D-erythritol 2,4-cyclodiphosphate synthase
MRIGHGYDVHKLVKDRKLILGGVDISYELGLLGHSDADVVCHAIIDALLGAMGLGDIGGMFPDTDESYKDVSSLDLLQQAYAEVKKHSGRLVNLDVTIIAQEPKLAPHISQMKANIAKTMKVSLGRLNIKATTEEGLGFTGKSEGIAVHCVCIV